MSYPREMPTPGGLEQNGPPQSEQGQEDPRITKRSEEIFGRISGKMPGLNDEQLVGLRTASNELAVEMVDLEDQAERDPLTNLYNRRGFFNVFDPILREHARILRERPNSTAGSIIKVDLDDFGITNKQIGEHQGDRVLEEVSAALNKVVRPGDQVGRFGGEEITIFAPGAHLDDAVRIAERARRAIPERVKSRGLHPNQTASFGVRQLPENLTAAELSELKFREGIFSETSFMADVAMRQAKREGKNAIVVVRNDGTIMRATAEDDPANPDRFIVNYFEPTPTNLTIPMPNLHNTEEFQSWMERHLTKPFKDYLAFPDPLGATRKQILDIVEFKLAKNEPIDSILKMVLTYVAEAA